jgi:excinuclease ABC subunit C
MQDKLANLPDAPGVYLYYDESRTVIYVGKAKVLKNRVRSYFHQDRHRDFKTSNLIRNIADLEVIIASSEKEALILENRLIKKYQPKYNILLRDDKHFLSIRLDPKEEWPRLRLVRRRSKDSATYFGPFPSSQALSDTIDFLQKTFPTRACDGHKFQQAVKQRRACLYHQIGRCPAPCIDRITPEEYQATLKAISMFMTGKRQDLIEELRLRMRAHADRLEFRDAARVRDQIRAIERVIAASHKVSGEGGNFDLVQLYREGGEAEVTIMYVREGSLFDSASYSFSNLELDDAEILAAVINQKYTEDSFIPEEIVVPFAFEEGSAMEEWLSEKRGRKVTLTAAQKGQKAQLLALALENAKQSFRMKRDESARQQQLLTDLQKSLDLNFFPEWIECYDISNIQGTNPVGSRVSFRQGRPDSAGYRHYKIRHVEGINDYAMMEEMLTRRFQRAIDEKQPLPNLVMIDGGKGHLAVAVRVLEALGLCNQLDIIGIAKDRSSVSELDLAMAEMAAEPSSQPPPPKISGEKIYRPGQKNPIRFPKNSSIIFLLQRVRDEAHRFAITFHRQQREKSGIRSILQDIPGIGPKRLLALRQALSLEELQKASVDEIAQIPGIPRALAETIYEFMQTASSQANKPLEKSPETSSTGAVIRDYLIRPREPG